MAAYGQQDAYAQQGIYSPASAPGFASPASAPGFASQSSAPGFAQPEAGYMSPAQPNPSEVYGQQGYAGDPYAQSEMAMSPSAAALSPVSGYDPGYQNYMYGVQQAPVVMTPAPVLSPPAPRRQVILASPAPRRRGFINTDNLLTILIVCGTLFLVALAMLLIVTVVVPRLTRKHKSGKKLHDFPLEENLADDDSSAMDAPGQQNVQAVKADPESEQSAHHGAVDARDRAHAKLVRRRKSG